MNSVLQAFHIFSFVMIEEENLHEMLSKFTTQLIIPELVG